MEQHRNVTFLAAQFVTQAAGTALIIWGARRLWRRAPMVIARPLAALKLELVLLAFALLGHRGLAIWLEFSPDNPGLILIRDQAFPITGAILTVLIGSQMVRLANLDSAMDLIRDGRIEDSAGNSTKE